LRVQLFPSPDGVEHAFFHTLSMIKCRVDGHKV
jgi:hypothetical protein